MQTKLQLIKVVNYIIEWGITHEIMIK